MLKLHYCLFFGSPAHRVPTITKHDALLNIIPHILYTQLLCALSCICASELICLEKELVFLCMA